MANSAYQVTVNHRHNLCISGRIDLTNIVQVSTEVKKIFDTMQDVHIDLSGVEYADSSSLAMLIECIRCAKNQHKEIVFEHMPQFMSDLARVCGLDSVLPTTKSLNFHN